MRGIFLSFLTCILALALNAQENDFVSVFDGKSLQGWTPSTENPESFFVQDGMLVCKGGRAHIFYTGDSKVGNVYFKNFELKLKARTTPGSNSGVYFHTAYQEEGWPSTGFEAQVNSTHTDAIKTGSLYGVVNVWAPKTLKDKFIARINKNREIFLYQPKAPSTDGEWFDYHIIVKENTIQVKVNGATTVEWTQPDDWTKDRRIGQGTIGFQAHDPKSEVHYKDIRIKVLD